MKASFRHIFAALAATAALAACTKEITPPNFENDKVNPASEGSRVIAVSFGKQQTKTTIEGFQPKFVNGKDTILLCTVPKDDNEPLLTDTCVVAVDENDVATISTNLTGQLAALYPAKFSKSDKGGVDITIPSVQSGKFSDANICRAEMEGEDDTSLHFENYCSILKFYVDTSIGVKSIKITSSTEHIASNSMTITVKAPEGKTLYDVMPSEGQDRRICYVALDGKDVHSNQLKFETETTTQGPVERTPTKNVLLKKGYMYNAFIPYYIEVNGQKWAYCNIGAFLPEDYGDYFMWAEVAGHKADLSIEPDEDGYIEGAFTFSETNPDGSRYHTSWDASKGFGLENAPYYAGAKEFSEKYKNTGDILQAEDDAAAVNWGGGWRMPTKAEFETLLNGTGTSTDDIGEKYLSIKGTNLKLPVAGTGDKLDLDLYNESGYWSSSSGKTSLPNFQFNLRGCSLRFISGEDACLEMDEEYSPRQMGMPIRPIYCDPAPHESDDDSDLLSGKFSVGDKTIMFSKGNLYWDGSSYQFESNQYDYRQFNGIQGDAAVISGISGTTPENTVGTFWWVPNHLVGESTKPYSEAPASNLGSRDDDIIFTNSNRTTANPEFTVNGKSGKYRTFTADELAAILFGRTDECRFAKAQVMGVNGLFIFPDDYSLPSGYSTEGGVGMSAINNETKPFPETNVPNDTWTKMESDGVVFLPAAGHRTSYFFSNIEVKDSGIGGYYWTNSLHGTGYNYEDATAGFMEFTGEVIDQNKNGYRKTGYSIRLVMDVSNN